MCHARMLCTPPRPPLLGCRMHLLLRRLRSLLAGLLRCGGPGLGVPQLGPRERVARGAMRCGRWLNGGNADWDESRGRQPAGRVLCI